jgi:hypothetical protein
VLLVAGVFAASVYGGYFGAAMGVMFLAVLGLALPVSLAHTSGLRAVLSMIVNGIAAVVFLVHGVPVLRIVVVVIGVGTAVKLLV